MAGWVGLRGRRPGLSLPVPPPPVALAFNPGGRVLGGLTAWGAAAPFCAPTSSASLSSLLSCGHRDREGCLTALPDNCHSVPAPAAQPGSPCRPGAPGYPLASLLSSQALWPPASSSAPGPCGAVRCDVMRCFPSGPLVQGQARRLKPEAGGNLLPLPSGAFQSAHQYHLILHF